MEKTIAHFSSAMCLNEPDGTPTVEDFDFCVEPKHADFSAETGGASRHLMVNGTDHRIAIKIKCSNNRLYKVSPVYTCLDPGKAKRLQVLREPGDSNGKDKLILIYKRTHFRNAKHAFQTDSGIGDDDEEDHCNADFNPVALAAARERDAPKKKLIALRTISTACLHFSPNELGSLTNSSPSHSSIGNGKIVTLSRALCA